ncbi:MAG TPA: hypothetical protein VH477_06015, partial [Bryobacteraceae bacterium]
NEEERSPTPEHEDFLHTLRSHFEPSKEHRPAEKLALAKNVNPATGSAPRQDMKSSADQPQPEKVEDRNSGSDVDQNRDVLPVDQPSQTKDPKPDTSSAWKQVVETSAEQLPPDAKAAPKTATLSERTVKSKPAEDFASTSVSRAREPNEPEDPEQAAGSAKPVGQLLDNAVALICDIAPNVTATPVPSKPNDNTPSRSATIHAAGVVEAPDASLPASDPIVGDLAFALRINADSSNTSDQADPKNTLLPRDPSSLLSNTAPPASSPAAQQEKLESQIQGLIAPTAANDHGSPTPHNAAPPEATTATHSSDFESELSKFRAAEPVRGAHVQISGTDAQRVDIRLVERAGALSVSVRSADSTLAKNLQEHAAELNTHLNLEHYRTELWTPSTNNASNTRDSGAGGQQNSGASYSGNGNQDQRQNSKQQQSQPDWIDTLEQNSKAFQKRIEYTWQQ